MKKTFNGEFVFRNDSGFRPVCSRAITRTGNFRTRPAWVIEIKREYFPGKYERHALLKAGVDTEETAKRAVKAAADILKRANNAAPIEGRAVYSYFVNRVYQARGVEELEEVSANFDRLLIEEARNYTE